MMPPHQPGYALYRGQSRFLLSQDRHRIQALSTRHHVVIPGKAQDWLGVAEGGRGQFQGAGQLQLIEAWPSYPVEHPGDCGPLL
jgi:hypothetical protein